MGLKITESSGQADVDFLLEYVRQYAQESWITKYNCVDSNCVGFTKSEDEDRMVAANWKLLGLTQLSIRFVYLHKNSDGTEYGHQIKLEGPCRLE